MKEKTETELIGLALYTSIAICWCICTAIMIYPLCSSKINGIVDFLLTVSAIMSIIGTMTLFCIYVILEHKGFWKKIDRQIAIDRDISFWRGQEIRECFLNSRRK